MDPALRELLAVAFFRHCFLKAMAKCRWQLRYTGRINDIGVWCLTLNAVSSCSNCFSRKEALALAASRMVCLSLSAVCMSLHMCLDLISRDVAAHNVALQLLVLFYIPCCYCWCLPLPCFTCVSTQTQIERCNENKRKKNALGNSCGHFGSQNPIHF